jgi:hypothetical protein
MRTEVKAILNQIANAAKSAGATDQEAKELAVSSFVSEAIKNGVSLKSAFDAVFGAGAYRATRANLLASSR